MRRPRGREIPNRYATKVRFDADQHVWIMDQVARGDTTVAAIIRRAVDIARAAMPSSPMETCNRS